LIVPDLTPEKKCRNLISLADLDTSEIFNIVNRHVAFSKGVDPEKPLDGKIVGVFFRKTSTRTRTAFSVAAAKLGATVVKYGPSDLQLNTGETVEDTARVLSCYLDILVMRTSESVEEMRAFAAPGKMAVVNAMSDLEHPTQALADLGTLTRLKGDLTGIHFLYMGEGNNSATALALALSRVKNARVTFLTPPGYGLPVDIKSQAQSFADLHGTVIEEYHHLDHLPKNVDVVYTTRWRTTGDTKSDPNWLSYFEPFKVTSEVMAFASKSDNSTIFMHDLPTVREEDVSSEVLDGPQSVAFHQAHHKLFGAMAALEWCLSKK